MFRELYDLCSRRAARPRGFALAALLLSGWSAAACDGTGARAGASGSADGANPGSDGAVAATDDAGRTVRLRQPARRIVSLLPAGTETLFALGAGDRVVGRTRYDAAPELAEIPSVGGGLDPSLETLASLRPDLVVAWEPQAGSRIRPRLEEMGIPVFAIQTRDTSSIFRNIRDLGRLTGRDLAADSLAIHIRATLDSVRASVPAGPRPSVLFVVSMDPPMIAGTGNFLAELIEVAGGAPLDLGGPRGLSPQVSLEELVRVQPDVVILPVGADPGLAAERLRREPGWRELHAVREGRVQVVPADLVNRPGPRLGETARMLRDAISDGSPPR